MSLALWYANNPDDVPEFEKQMRRKVHYVIKPEHLWNVPSNDSSWMVGDPKRIAFIVAEGLAEFDWGSQFTETLSGLRR